MSPTTKSLAVPAALQARFAEITALTDALCHASVPAEKDRG